MSIKTTSFSNFRDTITKLRSTNGCPWDRKQTIQSLKKYLLEESTELYEAMEKNDTDHMCEEAGDLLFVIMLMTEINYENDKFDIHDVINGIQNKMVRRHPHVFGDTLIGSEEELTKQWEKIKSDEAAAKII